MPSGRADPAAARLAFLTARPFAHRGLHGPGVLENSPAAFHAAIAAGWGIECDIQLSRDGEAFVFHDWTLDRLTGERGDVAARTADELAAIALAGEADPIPRLSEVLVLVAGRVRLLIEVKSRTRDARAACRAVQAALERYRGPVAVMSFNPEVARWFAAHAPETVRGLVVTEADEHGIWTRLKGALLRRLALRRARPDFLAYDVRALPNRFTERLRRRGFPVLTWTVRGVDPHRDTIAGADQIIFEAGR